MPAKNSIKDYAADSFYHVYNRGVEKRQIFLDQADYAVFLNLLKRYLSGESERDTSGRLYADLSGKVELLAFCLMPNHYHLLLYQHEPDGMESLLRRVNTTYSGYFNHRYDRVGALFQAAYKASRITNEAYLWHISRYIHLNPRLWEDYQFSSLPYYQGRMTAPWIKPNRVLALHEDRSQDYMSFLREWVDIEQDDSDIKPFLAG